MAVCRDDANPAHKPAITHSADSLACGLAGRDELPPGYSEAVCAARPGILSAIRDSPLQALAQGRQNHGGTESCREKDRGQINRLGFIPRRGSRCTPPPDAPLAWPAARSAER